MLIEMYFSMWHLIQVTALAELLPGWQFVWVPAMTFAEGGQEYHAEGLAVFSRHPIVDTSFVRLRSAHGVN